jgi:hypothetical protein
VKVFCGYTERSILCRGIVLSKTYPIFQKASFYLEKYGHETVLADAGQRSRAIIPGDDPGDQQPPERAAAIPSLMRSRLMLGWRK